MVKATSDIGEDVDEEDAPECVNCGAKIVQSPTHRVLTRIEDGLVHHFDFCDDDCLAEWRAEHEN